jgi:hypothetical protein
MLQWLFSYALIFATNLLQLLAQVVTEANNYMTLFQFAQIDKAVRFHVRLRFRTMHTGLYVCMWVQSGCT